MEVFLCAPFAFKAAENLQSDVFYLDQRELYPLKVALPQSEPMVKPSTLAVTVSVGKCSAVHTCVLRDDHFLTCLPVTLRFRFTRSTAGGHKKRSSSSVGDTKF